MHSWRQLLPFRGLCGIFLRNTTDYDIDQSAIILTSLYLWTSSFSDITFPRRSLFDLTRLLMTYTISSQILFSIVVVNSFLINLPCHHRSLFSFVQYWLLTVPFISFKFISTCTKYALWPSTTPRHASLYTSTDDFRSPQSADNKYNKLGPRIISWGPR